MNTRAVRVALLITALSAIVAIGVVHAQGTYENQVRTYARNLIASFGGGSTTQCYPAGVSGAYTCKNNANTYNFTLNIPLSTSTGACGTLYRNKPTPPGAVANYIVCSAASGCYYPVAACSWD